MTVPYRRTRGTLFKRDFGGDLWARCGDRLTLVDYGFLWKQAEPAWDNTTWWLFARRHPPSNP